MSLAHMTLDEVDHAHRSGRASDADVAAWVALWNATPCRFTVATMHPGNGGVTNRVKRDAE